MATLELKQLNKIYDNGFHTYLLVRLWVLKNRDYSCDSGDRSLSVEFANNWQCVIILNIDKVLRRWQLGTTIY